MAAPLKASLKKVNRAFIPMRFNHWSDFWAVKISSNKALIAVTSFTNDKINNEVNAYFSQQNDQLFNGFGINA